MAEALPTIEDECYFSDDSNPPNEFHADNDQEQEGYQIEKKKDDDDLDTLIDEVLAMCQQDVALYEEKERLKETGARRKTTVTDEQEMTEVLMRFDDLTVSNMIKAHDIETKTLSDKNFQQEKELQQRKEALLAAHKEIFNMTMALYAAKETAASEKHRFEAEIRKVNLSLAEAHWMVQHERRNRCRNCRPNIQDPYMMDM